MMKMMRAMKMEVKRKGTKEKGFMAAWSVWWESLWVISLCETLKRRAWEQGFCDA